MKSFILSLLMAVSICVTGYSQTNTTTVPQFMTDVWQTLVGEGLTNLSATIYGTYTPSIKEWGEGMVLMRNIPLGKGVSTGIGIGLDHYADQWFAVSAQVSINAAMKPFEGFGWTNLVVSPFSFIGLGTPFGDKAEDTTGNLETIAAIGTAVRIVKVGPGYFEAVGVWGTRTGLGAATGTFYGGGLNYTIMF